MAKTREQMIDEAVRGALARRSMPSILQRGGIWEAARRLGMEWRGHASWLSDDAPFLLMPRRLEAIRAEFRRISMEQGAV